MGGTVTVVSQPGVGSTFEVRLPLVAAEPALSFPGSLRHAVTAPQAG
jgi:hypothetical protein